ncbi:hypothetical protein CL634_10535 [bacterium]|nr:hypothetical protein [bacterium]
MKAAVLGIGKMGTAICWAMKKLGFYVVGADSNEIAGGYFREHIDGPSGAFYVTNQNNAGKSIERVLSFEKPDIVISSLPYHQTEEMAYLCVDNEFRYCDLGGRVDVSKNINDYAKQKAVKPVFTDLGLAPGWVNILAEEGYRKLHGEAEVTSVEMMVGGLPDYLESNNNPLRYGITWSIDGLINEYRDDCLVLEDGEIKTVKGMEGLQIVEGDSFGPMEAFYTSGGASHTIHSMRERGVQNCFYKTLRYKGHRDIVRFLIRDCKLDDETLNKIFLEGCGKANKDEVIIVASVHKDNKSWNEEKVIKVDDRFSAMQKATAFPISSVAAIMAQGKLEGDKEQHRDWWLQHNKSLSYADVPFDEFNKNLITLKQASQA